MITRNFKICLNAGTGFAPHINANQYDSGETWVFELFTEAGIRYIPASGAIIGLKADGKAILNNGSVDSEGRVVITETEQMTAAAGRAVYELLIDNNTHGTANFVVKVEERPTDEAEISDSDLSLIQQAIDSTNPETIAEGVSDWMDEHLTPTTPVVDDTLTVSGAAADAKKVGDEVNGLKSAINTIPKSAELDDEGIATFYNDYGVTLFTLDLSDIGTGGATYGNLIISKETLEIGEGLTDTFTVKLESAPSGNQPVYIAVSNSSKISVSPQNLTFTSANYNNPQTVTVTALEDEGSEDENETITITSRKVTGKQIAVAITDNDFDIVRRGLVLNADFRGLESSADTFVDSQAELSFTNLSYFTKFENGIGGGETKYRYLTVVNDDKKAPFLSAMKETGGFTVELFGTTQPMGPFFPNYKVLAGTGSASPNGIGGWYNSPPVSSPTAIYQDDTTGNPTIEFSTGHEFTIAGTSKRLIFWGESTFPYASEFRHVVFTYSPNGEVYMIVNGVKCDAPVTVENFKAWDFNTMFGGNFSLTNDTAMGTNFVSFIRLYNRVLTDAEILNNMKANCSAIGLTTF